HDPASVLVVQCAGTSRRPRRPNRWRRHCSAETSRTQLCASALVRPVLPLSLWPLLSEPVPRARQMRPPLAALRVYQSPSSALEAAPVVRKIIAAFPLQGGVPVTGTNHFSQPDTAQNTGFCASKKGMYPI